MTPTLVVLAAGMGSRYGGLKQVDPVGPGGETLMDYAVYDALRAGFGTVVFVIRRDFEKAFRDQVEARYGGAVPIDYAFQSLEDLPEGFGCPAGRTKPWGTAHAIRSVREIVNTPFATINADDFYGRDAFVQLAAFLSRSPATAAGTEPDHFAMVGFELGKTLSPHGSVARGVCEIADGDRLASVVEYTGIAATPDGGIEGRAGERPVEPLRPDARVSVNMWGFTTALFRRMEPRFAEWLEVNAANPKAEWYIPSVVNELVQDGIADVRVLPATGQWFGVTYREDRPLTVEAIGQRVAAGEYPARLWK